LIYVLGFWVFMGLPFSPKFYIKWGIFSCFFSSGGIFISCINMFIVIGYFWWILFLVEGGVKFVSGFIGGGIL